MSDARRAAARELPPDHGTETRVPRATCWPLLDLGSRSVCPDARLWWHCNPRGSLLTTNVVEASIRVGQQRVERHRASDRHDFDA